MPPRPLSRSGWSCRWAATGVSTPANAGQGFEKGFSMSKNGHDFSVGDHVVYPAHGVGQVQGIETQDVAGLKLEVYVITFDHEKMTLRVPTAKARTAGLRALAETNVVTQALPNLTGSEEHTS